VSFYLLGREAVGDCRQSPKWKLDGEVEAP